MRKQNAQMKYIVAMALMLNLGVASVYAQRYPVRDSTFGNYRAQRGQSTAARHDEQRLGSRRKRFARLIYFSRCQGYHTFCALAQHYLLGAE